MPRPRKPARLWQRPDDGAWIILDGGKHHRTGYSGESGRGSAEDALRDYLVGRKEACRVGPAQPSEVLIGEVLALYAREVGPTLSAPATLAASIKSLAPFWGGKSCDAVKGSTCRAYGRLRAEPITVEYRGKKGGRWSRTLAASNGTIRRELGVLQAALNHAHGEGVLIYAPTVTLPEGGAARDRWLTRDEAARLLRAAAPHVRRFIVIALASGRRASAILGLRIGTSLDSGWVDPERGIIHFEGARQKKTKKRRGSIQAPAALAGHMRRWSKKGGSHAIMWRGSRPAEIDTGLAAAARRAGLDGVSPHVLKHTAVTWAFQRGMSLEDAADWFATSPATLMKHYRAHSPHYQARARAVMERK